MTPAKSSHLLNTSETRESVDETQIQALRRLEDSLFCWLLDVPPHKLRQQDQAEKTIHQSIQKRLRTSGLEELPRRPSVLPRLMSALSNENIKRSELTDIILSDASLTDQLLDMANSPFFRPGDHVIESVEQAIFLLGTDGIRQVASAAVLRPMMAARNSQEALFAQRAWRWGLTCARAAESLAQRRNADSSGFFLVGLIPSLAYLTLSREVRQAMPGNESSHPSPAILNAVLRAWDWETAQAIAHAWQLPPQYHAWLLAAERPARNTNHTPLNDGILIGTRETLRNAHQLNLPEEDLLKSLDMSAGEYQSIRAPILAMLEGGKQAAG